MDGPPQRIALGLTQEQVGKLAKHATTTISELENGALESQGYQKISNFLATLLLGLDIRRLWEIESGLAIAS